MKSKNKTREKQSALLEQTLLEKIENLTAYVRKELEDIHRVIKENELAADKAGREIAACQEELINLGQKDLFEQGTVIKANKQDDSGTLEIDEGLFEESETLDFIRHKFGADVAIGIAREFGGCMVYIPKKLFTKNNHDRIRAAYREGATYKELAEEYGYTVSYIRDIIHRRGRNSKWQKKDVSRKL